MATKDNDNSTTITVKCPTCNTEVSWKKESDFRPFCSSRCRDKDFIAWANEEKVIKGNSLYDDILSDDLMS